MGITSAAQSPPGLRQRGTFVTGQPWEGVQMHKTPEPKCVKGKLNCRDVTEPLLCVGHSACECP